jgi:hypothetical protein
VADREWQTRERELHFFFFNLKTIATSVWKFFWVHLFGFLALLFGKSLKIKFLTKNAF